MVAANAAPGSSVVSNSCLPRFPASVRNLTILFAASGSRETAVPGTRGTWSYKLPGLVKIMSGFRGGRYGVWRRAAFPDGTWACGYGEFHFGRPRESLKGDGAPKSGARAAAYRTLAPLLTQHLRAVSHPTIRRFSSAQIRATVNSLMKDPCGRST